MDKIIEKLVLFHQSDVLTIVFGVTAGLFTLVGFSTIFISMNSQHKIEKAREFLWEIGNIPYKYTKYNDDRIGKETYHLYSLYNSILNSKDKTMRNLITFVKGIFIFIAFSWISTCVFLMNEFHIAELIYVSLIIIVAICFLYLFYRFISKLCNITELAGLPKYEDLLDLSKENKGISVVSIAGISMILTIRKKSETHLKISVGFPVPFTGAGIGVCIYGNKDNSKEKDSSEFIVNDYEPRCWIEKDKYVWCLNNASYFELNLLEFEMPQEISEINFQIALNCIRGVINVHFDNIKIEVLKNMDIVSGHYFNPNRFNEIYVENRDQQREQ